MKTFLMHPDRDFDPRSLSPRESLPYAQDIELEVLLNGITFWF